MVIFFMRPKSAFDYFLVPFKMLFYSPNFLQCQSISWENTSSINFFTDNPLYFLFFTSRRYLCMSRLIIEPMCHQFALLIQRFLASVAYWFQDLQMITSLVVLQYSRLVYEVCFPSWRFILFASAYTIFIVYVLSTF